jgi:hypothetical protein
MAVGDGTIRATAEEDLRLAGSVSSKRDERDAHHTTPYRCQQRMQQGHGHAAYWARGGELRHYLYVRSCNSAAISRRGLDCSKHA